MTTTSAAPAAVRAHVNRVPRSAWTIGEWSLSISRISVTSGGKERERETYGPCPAENCRCAPTDAERDAGASGRVRTRTREPDGAEISGLRALSPPRYLSHHRAHHRRTEDRATTTSTMSPAVRSYYHQCSAVRVLRRCRRRRHRPSPAAYVNRDFRISQARGPRCYVACATRVFYTLCVITSSRNVKSHRFLGDRVISACLGDRLLADSKFGSRIKEHVR